MPPPLKSSNTNETLGHTPKFGETPNLDKYLLFLMPLRVLVPNQQKPFCQKQALFCSQLANIWGIPNPNPNHQSCVSSKMGWHVQ
jgi:hypothetical protein